MASWLDRYNLYPVSMSNIHRGPAYTYQSGDHSTTVDYVISGATTASIIEDCWTADDVPGNVSDHLPISVSLKIDVPINAVPEAPVRLDWERALAENIICRYTEGVQHIVSTSLRSSLTTVNNINDEIVRVSDELVNLARTVVPNKKYNRKPFIKDNVLGSLCHQNRIARSTWIKRGRPRCGPSFNEMTSARRTLKSYLAKCRAREERKTLLKRDALFREGNVRRFKKPNNNTRANGSRIHDGSSLLSDPHDVLSSWKDHFQDLGKSVLSVNPTLSHLLDDVPHMVSASRLNEDSTLDWDITIDEIQCKIRKLKRWKSPGPDGVLAEHILYGGESIKVWLLFVFNRLLQCESIPKSFKQGITVPLYKGKGRDPLNRGSYRGITVTSVFSKLFEYILLDRITPVLQDAGHPCLYQTAYQEGLTCEEAIFTTQEAIRTLLQQNGHAFLTLYDVEKAFDSVEFPVLLRCLFNAGLNGKSWRLIKNWYEGSETCVKIQGRLSDPIVLERGVRQGSVLSPLLFIVIMDGLANLLLSRKAGTTLDGLFVGGALHADDVRTVCNDKRGVEEQAGTVNDFVTENGPKINPSKTEIVAFAVNENDFRNDCVKINEIDIVLSSQGCCLGYWWHRSLMSSKAVDENVLKARKAFFAAGCLGAFQGQLNPLSSRSIYLTSILPVLLYGCENLILNEVMLNQLESFQAWAGKRLLGLSKYHSNTIVPIALDVRSVRSLILVRKLRFLAKLVRDGTGDSFQSSLSGRLFASLAMKDAYNISVVSQCLYLEVLVLRSVVSSSRRMHITWRDHALTPSTIDQDLCRFRKP